jgi:DNA-binding NarL/FixJ family response regulator
MRILVCDDHAIFRSGLLTALSEIPREVELLEAADAVSALEAVQAGGIDLVLLDLQMPGMDGWQALRRLRQDNPGLAVVIVSASEEAADVRAALDSGASGFIPKSSTAPLLRAALEVVLSGGVYVPSLLVDESEGAIPVDSEPERRRERASQLTPRQREVLILMSRGLSNREIGEALGIAPGTVKTHLSALFEILDVSNRTEATLVMGELDLES